MHHWSIIFVLHTLVSWQCVRFMHTELKIIACVVVHWLRNNGFVQVQAWIFMRKGQLDNWRAHIRVALELTCTSPLSWETLSQSWIATDISALPNTSVSHLPPTVFDGQHNHYFISQHVFRNKCLYIYLSRDGASNEGRGFLLTPGVFGKIGFSFCFTLTPAFYPCMFSLGTLPLF